MVGGRKNINIEASKASEIYFAHWIYGRLEHGRDLRPDEVIAVEENEIYSKENDGSGFIDTNVQAYKQVQKQEAQQQNRRCG